MSPSNKIIRLPELIAKTSLSRSTLYALEKRGSFPQKIKLGERSMGWLEAEVDAWLEAKAAERTGV